MRTEKHYRWRVQWIGKWKTTRFHCSQADIRVEHPEAVCLPDTLIEREVPDTKEEMDAQTHDLSTSVTKPGRKIAAKPSFPEINPRDVPF